MFVVASIMYNSIYSNVISFSFCKSEAWSTDVGLSIF
jgi:hypothetical protein